MKISIPPKKNYFYGEGCKRMLSPSLLRDSPRLIKSLSQEQTFFDLNNSVVTNLDEKILHLNYKLSLCGRYATKNFYCKKHEGNNLLKTTRAKFSCEIHYCNHPDCLVQRFSRQLETFKDIKRFDGLRKLWHFSIGFPAISLHDYKKNFSKHKRRYESVLNRFCEKLRKKGLNIQAVRVLDFSFVKKGYVFPHYHFGAIPIGQKRIRSSLILIHKVRKEMIRKQKILTPFIFKDWGLASKTGVLSYLSIRSSGMYKYNSTHKTNYKKIKSKLRDSIEAGKYLLLKDILTPKEYIKSFYNKPHFVTIGGLPRPSRHGSNITDGIPCFCPLCGHLERKDVRVEIIFDESKQKHNPPPNIPIKIYPELKIEVIRIR